MNVSSKVLFGNRGLGMNPFMCLPLLTYTNPTNLHPQFAKIKLTVKSFLQTYFQQKNFFGFEWCNIIWYNNKNSKQKLVRLDLTTLKKLSNLLQNNSIFIKTFKNSKPSV